MDNTDKAFDPNDMTELYPLYKSDLEHIKVLKQNANNIFLKDGGGGNGSGEMVPQMNGGGNVELTITGTGVIPAPAIEVKQATFANNSDSDFMVVHEGAEFPVFARGYFTFFGLTNLSELSVKGNGSADKVYIRWEN